MEILLINNRFVLSISLLLFFPNILGAQSLAHRPESNSTYRNRWTWSEQWNLSGISSEESSVLSKSTRAEISGRLRLIKSFDEQLVFSFTPAVRFISGRDQDVFADRLPKDKLYAEEAELEWRIFSASSLEAGALNQGALRHPLIVSSRPFPGARLRLDPYPRDWRGFVLTSQVAVPTSYTLDLDTTADEPLPRFFTHSAAYAAALTSDLRSRVSVTHFTYTQLPQIVALTSKRHGNSVDVISSSTGRFRHEFEGVGATLDAELEIAPLRLSWSGEWIENLRAPSSLNSGWNSTVMAQLPITPTHDLGLSFSTFRVEPDTSPAIYSDAIFATNRVGLGGEVFAIHRRWNLRFSAAFSSDEPLYENDLMGKRQILMLSVGNIGESVTRSF